MSTYSAIFFGDTGVGKSTFLTRVSQGVRAREVRPTIGVDNIIYRNAADTLRCWDTGGSDRFVHIVPLFIRKCDVAVYVFDARKPQTLVNIQKWYDLVCVSDDAPREHVILGLCMSDEIPVANYYPMEMLDGRYAQEAMNDIIRRARHQRASMDIELIPAQRQCCFGLC